MAAGATRNLCGADRDRTDDLRLAKPALSQLSYSPFQWKVAPPENRVGQGRVELPTSRLSGVRSNHLSYWPQPVPRWGCLTKPGWLCGFPEPNVATLGGNPRSLETEPYALAVPKWAMTLVVLTP